MVKKLIKEILYLGMRYSGYLAIRDRVLYAKGKTWCTILLYHRVSPELDNDPVDINISPEKFKQQMQALSRYYNIITVTELLEHIRNNRSFPPRTVCITFDDSYKTIYDHAMPVLKELNIPACFFINDGYIDTERTYPWDEVLDKKQAMMSWDDVNEMIVSGFEIGVHTSNHLDLAKLDKGTAEKEICGSRSVLEKKLGISLPFFSIPFGRRENFTEETIDIIKKGNFSCCFSAYGGVVDTISDLYNLERMPFSSDYHSVNELCADIDRVF